MPKVTSLEKIKRQKGWFELKLDNAISFPINDELILKYLIKTGKQFLPHEVKEIREDGEYRFLKKKALDALSRRRLSEKELRRKLRPVPKSSQYIDRLIEELRALGIIDDLDYAAAVIHTLQVGGAKSKRYIRNKLYQKGLPKEISDKAIEKELDDYDEAGAALAAAKKKFKSVKKLPAVKAKKRVADFLRGRGFNWDDIRAALNELFQEDD
jgi:regulatory protein